MLVTRRWYHSRVCGRVSLTSSDHREAAGLIAGMVSRFDASALSDWLARAHYRPRYNVGPGQDHYVVRARRGRPILARARWGMPGRTRELVINARAETIGERPLFRAAFERTPCLVVADGFFEWPRKGEPQPWWFRRREGGLLLAGVLHEAAEPGVPDEFVVVTVPANAEVALVHHRMPALIDPGVHEQWLFGERDAARALLVSAADGSLQARAVSRRINSLEHDDPSCIAPVEPGASQLPLLR